ncbi:MAG: aldehyde dehydrogenase [Elusimicrobia bacterium RIFOXYD12_FULL_66_9]|nr:MAG: aldehyde dehydrogenase [Elusimicrobia bacterium RIFOXYD12_FULL_66_9]
MLTQMWIAGKPISSFSGRTFPVVNPADGKVLAQVAEGGVHDVDLAVKTAIKAASGPWGKMGPRERARRLFEVARIVRERLEEFTLLETRNTGKPLADSRDEANVVADCFEFYAGAVSKHHGETIPVGGPGLDFTLREPIGVCALIVPWNFPMMIAAWKMAPALACGNTVVLKPASYTPLTALLLGQVCTEAGIPDGVVNVITGPGGVVGSALAGHLGVRKISFTGETTTGAHITKVAADSIKRVSLELGGKSPNIVFDDADLDLCVQKSIWSVFGNTGQDCCARSRAIVHRKVYDKFLEKFVAGTKKIVIGHPEKKGVQMGPMISAKQRDSVCKYIDAGKAEGAKILCGGARPGGALAKGYYLTPAVFADCDTKMKIVQEEIFGPVLSVLPFKDEEEAIRLANDSPYGLSGSLWTRDVGRVLRVTRAMQTGVISVNTSTSVHLEAPFGGYKTSGLGRELGLKSLDLYSEVKNVFISSL